MRALLLVVLSSWLYPLAATASGPPVLVVFDLQNRGSGLATRHLKKLSASLSKDLLECEHQVIAPAEVLVQLKKLNRRVPRKRMAQARMLKARYILVGSIRKKHSYCRIDAFLMDVKTGDRQKNFSAEADCRLSDLIEALPTMTAAICKRLQVKKPALKKKPQDLGGTLDDAVSAMEEIAGLKTLPGPRLPKGKTAKVSIRSDPPGAKVSWDAKPLGRTPLQIEKVELRHHRLELSLAGHVPWRETLNITSSVGLTISLFQSRRKVRVNTHPQGARLYVNGDRRGRAPVEVTLPAGRRHEIRASLKDHEETFMEFVALPATAKAPPQEVTVKLAPRPVYLMLDVAPAQARVVIGKEQLTGSGTVGVIPGKQTIRASAEGYQSRTLEVDIPVGKPYQLQLRLERRPEYFEYQEALASKRVQAWTTLTVSILAASAAVPMIKWSLDSDRAAEEWKLTARLAESEDDNQAALAKSQEAEDQALWTGIIGYGSVALGVLALGWSLYSFLTCPDQPSFPKLGVTADRFWLRFDF